MPRKEFLPGNILPTAMVSLREGSLNTSDCQVQMGGSPYEVGAQATSSNVEMCLDHVQYSRTPPLPALVFFENTENISSDEMLSIGSTRFWLQIPSPTAGSSHSQVIVSLLRKTNTVQPLGRSKLHNT